MRGNLRDQGLFLLLALNRWFLFHFESHLEQLANFHPSDELIHPPRSCSTLKLINFSLLGPCSMDDPPEDLLWIAAFLLSTLLVLSSQEILAATHLPSWFSLLPFWYQPTNQRCSQVPFPGSYTFCTKTSTTVEPYLDRVIRETLRITKRSNQDQERDQRACSKSEMFRIFTNRCQDVMFSIYRNKNRWLC